MLRVTVELVPHGDEERKRELGKMEIQNVGGDEILGEYIMQYVDEHGPSHMELGKHMRARSFWALVEKAAGAAGRSYDITEIAKGAAKLKEAK